ncbi:MAG: helix-turn-helix domain-containing protein [Halofilum sp. (in: g-proteobacteria)]|nr:helix-turn-helix domain-containing protein [Halofilum sp. (in: g-proteobacteria)]
MIGERIRRARKAAGLSLRALAEQAGVSHTTLEQVRTRAADPRLTPARGPGSRAWRAHGVPPAPDFGSIGTGRVPRQPAPCAYTQSDPLGRAGPARALARAAGSVSNRGGAAFLVADRTAGADRRTRCAGDGGGRDPFCLASRRGSNPGLD